MAIIFFLPKEKELSNLGITKLNIKTNNFVILDPSKLIVDGPNGKDRDAIAQNIINAIEDIAPAKTDLYLLYHIGDSTNINSYLSRILPQLTSRRYSHTDREENYKKILTLINEVSENKFVGTVESIIKDFFYDKELEAKLELLHRCLVPSQIPNSLPNELENNSRIQMFENAFVTFKSKWRKETDDEIFNPLYIKELTEFRKILLGS